MSTRIKVAFSVISALIVVTVLNSPHSEKVAKNAQAKESGVDAKNDQQLTKNPDSSTAENLASAELPAASPVKSPLATVVTNQANVVSTPETAIAKAVLFNGVSQNNQPFVLKPAGGKKIIAQDANAVKTLLLSAGDEYLKLAANDDIQITNATTDDMANVFYTYQQTYKGVPVEGKFIVVQTDSSDEVKLVSGQFESSLNVDTTPVISGDAAIQTALSSLADSSVYAPVVHEAPELRIYVDQQTSNAMPAYRAVVEYSDSKALNHLEEIFVSANDGAVLKAYTLIHSALNREVYSTKYNYCIGTPGIPESYTLPGTYRFGESGPDYYADSEERNAYSNTGSSYWFYRRMFNRDSYNSNGIRLRSSVHSQFMTPNYTCTGNNAQYRPEPYDQLIFGTGDNGPGMSESLDVVGHELTHGVTHYTSDLKYENETGAINEAVSDIFGAGIEAWKNSGGSSSGNPSSISSNSNTWIVCSSCESRLKRYMNNPTQDGQSKDYYPEKYAGTDDNGGVHLNSGIMNLAFYLLSEGGRHPRGKTTVTVSGIGIEKALRIYYDANTTLFKVLTNTSNAFSSARSLLAQAAENRYGQCSNEWKAVHASFQAVGVGGSIPACSGSGSTTPTEPAPQPDTNLALSATPYASSYYRSGYEPAKLKDGSTSTRWLSRLVTSPYQGEYVALDFGQQKAISEITIKWDGSNYAGYFYIQALDSSNSWRTVKSMSKSSTGDTKISLSTNTRMMRVVMYYGGYYRWFGIKELVVK